MQRLEVSAAVPHIYMSLGFKRLRWYTQRHNSSKHFKQFPLHAVLRPREEAPTNYPLHISFQLFTFPAPMYFPRSLQSSSRSVHTNAGAENRMIISLQTCDMRWLTQATRCWKGIQQVKFILEKVIKAQKGCTGMVLGYLSRYSGWTVRDRIPVGGEIFRTCTNRPWDALSLPCNGYGGHRRG